MSAMERRLRRQESASSALGGSSLPRPPNAGASVNLPPTGAPSSSGHGGTVDPATAKQWEEYCAALEGDHEELRGLFHKQQAELASLAAVLAEHKLKEAQLRALESQIVGHEDFLQEVLQLIALGDGGRPGLKARTELNTGKAGKEQRLSMDAVRDAIQKQQRRMQALKKSEESTQAALRSLRQDAATPPSTATDTAAATAAPSSWQDCIVPGAAKEVQDMKQQLRTLERRLQASETDARNLTNALKEAEHALAVKDRAATQAKRDAEGFQKLLSDRDELLRSADKRCRAMEKELRALQQRQPKDTTNALSAAASKKGEDGVRDTTSNSVGDKHHTTTHHFRLLHGAPYADILRTQPAAFQEAFLKDASAAVHVPVAFLKGVRARVVGGDADGLGGSGHSPGADESGVGVDVDIKHNASLTEAAVDVLLLEGAFPHLDALKEDATAAVRATLRAEAAEMSAQRRRAEQECAALAKRVSALEASAARKDADWVSHDCEVNIALEEAEATVKELYRALESAREDNTALSAEVAKVQVDARAWEAKATAAETQLSLAKKSSSGALSQLTATEAQVRQAEKRSKELEKERKQLAARHQLEVATLKESLRAANVEVGIGVFDIPNGGLPLPIAELADVVTSLTTDTPRGGGSSSAQQGSGFAKKGILKAFYDVLLCEVAVATGTVPVQVTRCVGVKKGGTSAGSPRATAVLQLSFELAFYANPDNAAHVRADIAEKLASCPFTAALDFLQHQWELSKATAATAKDRAAVERSGRQLQEQLTSVEAKLDRVLTVTERKTAATAMEKVDLLVARLRAVEASLRECRDGAAETVKETKKLAVSEAAAKDSVGALAEKVRRLEAAPLEKQQQRSSANNSLLHDTSATSERAEEVAGKRERELLAKLQEQQRELAQLRGERDSLRREADSADAAMVQLQQRIRAVEQKTSTPSSPKAAAANAEKVRQLEEALRAAETDRDTLQRQVGEMETDMNDLSQIQASLQNALEAAQTELRAKKQDVDVLTAKVRGLEDCKREQQGAARNVQQPRPAARVDPAAMAEEEEEAAANPSAIKDARPSMTTTTTANKRRTALGNSTSAPAAAAAPAAPAAVALEESVKSSGDGASVNASTRGRGPPVPETIRPPKNSSLHPPLAANTPTAASKRTIKRSNSALQARAFGRTHSTPVAISSVSVAPAGASSNHSSPHPGAGANAGICGTLAPNPSGASGGQAASTTAIFTRSATSIPTTPAAAAAPRARGIVEAPPRLSSAGHTNGHPAALVLHRQDARTYFSNTASALKGGGPAAPASSAAHSSSGEAASLTRERRHVSPVAGAGRRPASSPITNASGSAAATAPAVASQHAHNTAFHRSQTAIPNGAYTRTPSGYRKVNPSH